MTMQSWLMVPGRLREGMEARSYKREIIFMYGTGSFAIPLLQSWRAIDREGFEHTMALMTKEKDCHKITSFEPRFGCTWSTAPLPDEVGDRMLLGSRGGHICDLAPSTSARSCMVSPIVRLCFVSHSWGAWQGSRINTIDYPPAPSASATACSPLTAMSTSFKTRICS